MWDLEDPSKPRGPYYILAKADKPTRFALWRWEVWRRQMWSDYCVAQGYSFGKDRALKRAHKAHAKILKQQSDAQSVEIQL